MFKACEIASAVDGLCFGNPDASVDHFVYDTRTVCVSSRSMFIAMRTEWNDGHDYVNSAVSKGISCFLVERKLPLNGITQVVVKDTLLAIQSLAKWHRNKFDIPVIGITGSNGKTSVKEWVNQLLCPHFKICRSPRSFNSQLGVALSLLQLNDSHQMAVFEAGISKPDEMDALAEMIQPNVGIYTHKGKAHVGDFNSVDHIQHEKWKLFSKSTVILAPHTEVQGVSDERLITWGDYPSAFTIKTIRKTDHFTEVEWEENGILTWLTLPFVDQISVSNALTAVSCARYFDVSWGDIKEVIPEWVTPQMRMEKLEGRDGSIIINDAYSLDLRSLELAIGELKTTYQNRTASLIISELPVGDQHAQVEYQQLGVLLNSASWKNCWVVGAQARKWAEYFPPHTVFMNTVEDGMKEVGEADWSGQVILIKGARKFGFEKWVNVLQDKVHQTVLEVDLNALKNNLSFFKSKLNTGTKLLVMVKAFGYGSGAREMAQWLELNQVDYLGVAYVDEGVALRKWGVSLPILVMNSDENGVQDLIKYHLEAEVYSMNQMKRMLHVKRNLGISERLKIHIKCDTGMHRLGLLPTQIDAFVEYVKNEKDVEVISAFTHLAAAEDVQHDAFTALQLDRFQQMTGLIKKMFPQVFFHAANTGAIQRWPSAEFQMVRLGIGLYGVSSWADEQSQLMPVQRWMTRISQIKNIAQEDTVGYGRSFVAQNNMQIAIIPVGYADGLSRSLSNGKGIVYVNGLPAPIVGRVCMDMTMIDVTDLPCQEGDSVEIFGKEQSLIDFAEKCNTIPYEVLTSISTRVKRIYAQEV